MGDVTNFAEAQLKGLDLSQQEQEQIKKQIAALEKEIVFNRAHEDSNAFTKLILKKWEQVETLEGEARFFAALALLTVIYFFIFYPLGYQKTIGNIVRNHVPVDSKAFSLFATGSVLGSLNAFHEGAPVAGTGYAILAVLGWLTVVINEYIKQGIRSGRLTPKAGGMDSLVNFLKTEKFFLKFDAEGKLLQGTECLDSMGYSASEVSEWNGKIYELFIRDKASLKTLANTIESCEDGRPDCKFPKKIYPIVRAKNGTQNKSEMHLIPIFENGKITGYYMIGEEVPTSAPVETDAAAC